MKKINFMLIYLSRTKINYFSVKNYMSKNLWEKNASYILICIFERKWRRHEKKWRNNWINKKPSFTNLLNMSFNRGIKSSCCWKLFLIGLCLTIGPCAYFGKLWVVFLVNKEKWVAWKGKFTTAKIEAYMKKVDFKGKICV